MFYGKGKKCFDEENWYKAIQYFAQAMVKAQFEKNIEQIELAQRDLARTYFRIPSYDDAYGHFEELLHNTNSENLKNYSITMMATIKTIRAKDVSEYREALEILEGLPHKENNLINKVFLLCYIAKYGNDLKAICDAEKTLEELNQLDLSPGRKCKLLQSKGMIYLIRKEFDFALQCFKSAVRQALNDTDKARFLNNIAETYLEIDDLDSAEKTLGEINHYLPNITDKTEKATYLKLYGILLRKRKKGEDAAGYLLEAANIFKEHGILRELAEIKAILADQSFSREGIHKSVGFYRGVELFSEHLFYEKEAEEVEIKDAKIACMCDTALGVDDDGGVNGGSGPKLGR